MYRFYSSVYLLRLLQLVDVYCIVCMFTPAITCILFKCCELFDPVIGFEPVVSGHKVAVVISSSIQRVIAESHGM